MGAIRRTAFLSVMLLAASLQAQSALPPGTWRIAGCTGRAAVSDFACRSDRRVHAGRDAPGTPGSAGARGAGVRDQVLPHRRGWHYPTHRPQEGVTAGRTSHRLRSSANAPKAWAAPLVAAYAGRRTRDVGGFAVDLGDKVGVLRPITEQAMCASCHGPAEKVSPAVREALGRKYPRDLATGFSEGEIRGWFWVEVPKKRKP